MAKNLKSIDEFEVYLGEKVMTWSEQQQVAFLAAFAERWLPAYNAFSEAEDWGDPQVMMQSLEAVWSHVAGRTLPKTSAARYIGQIGDVTPHMDDFDAPEALMACAILSDALKACADPQNARTHVSNSAMGVVETMLEEWWMDSTGQEHMWNKSIVRKEVQAQVRLAERIDGMSVFDEGSVKALRSQNADLAIKLSQLPEHEPSSRQTNQSIFEFYRRLVENDIRGHVQMDLVEEDTIASTMINFGYWALRYSRRRDAIDRLTDDQGRQALIKMNRARDQAETGLPDWHGDMLMMIELCLKNPGNQIDAVDLASPHGYGPSLRRLWLEGRRLGHSDEDAWAYVRAWGHRRPDAWAIEDGRKKKGWAYGTPALGERLAQPLSWRSTDQPAHPWTTQVSEATWRVRINDFPDELMYSLIIGDEPSGDFHDWPESWERTRED